MASPPFRIVYDPEVARHIRAIDRGHHRHIREEVEDLLSYEPRRAARNRKPLRGPTSLGGDLWEIRFGPDNRFRVFYDTDEASRTVVVRAVGEKRGSCLFIAGEEVSL